MQLKACLLLWAVAPPSLEASTSNTPGLKTFPPALGVAGSVQLEPGSQEEKRDSQRTPLSLAAAWGCEHRNFRTNSRLFTCGFCSWWLFTFLQCWEGRSWASRALAHRGESAVLTDSVSYSASLHPRGHWLAWQACRRLGYRMGDGTLEHRVQKPCHHPLSQCPTHSEETLSQGLRAETGEKVWGRSDQALRL